MADNDSRKGFRYTDSALLDYVAGVHAAHDDGLSAAFETPDGDDMPAIMVGPSEGKLLELLVRMSGAKKIVEIGCLAGYSAIRMARALPADGKLWSIEYQPRYAERARANVATAGLSDRVDIAVGAALEVLPTLEQHGPFDLVFIDADKGNYDQYGRWAAANLRPGGLLIGDNAFLFGNLMDDTDTARAMRRFHEQAAGAFDSVCVPTPDGMLVGIKRP
jgi:caffeoyl-CoA O-methyltransferase